MNLGGPLSRDFAPACTVGPGGQPGADMLLSGHQGTQERVLEHLVFGGGGAPPHRAFIVIEASPMSLQKALDRTLFVQD